MTEKAADLLAVAPCGHGRIWLAAEVASEESKRSRFYRDAARRNYAVEHVTTDEARKRLGGCEKCRKR